MMGEADVRNLLELYPSGMTALVLTTGLIIGGCGGTEDPSETPDPTQDVEPTAEPTLEPTAEPTAEEDEITVRISAPNDGRFVSMNNDANLSVDVSFLVPSGNFELAASSADCTTDWCGQVALMVDGDVTNTAYESPAQAYFAGTSSPADTHELTVRLINFDGSDVINRGEVVEDTIDVITTNPIPSAIVILTPVEGEVTPTNSASLPVLVTFTSTGITLVEDASECGDANVCGFSQVLVDGVVNNEGTTSPLTANFADVDDPYGEHTISVRAMDFDGNVLQADGLDLIDSVDVDVQEPFPAVAITGFNDGDSLHIQSSSAELTGEIPFLATNFLVAADETCQGSDNTPAITECGQVLVHIDGDAGNTNGGTYNNVASASPAEAWFVALDEPYGHHTVTLSLVYHTTGDPVMVNGEAVTDTVDLFVVSDDEASIQITAPIEGQPVAINRELDPEQQNFNIRFDINGDFLLLQENADGDCPGEFGNPPCGDGYVKVKMDGTELGVTQSSPFVVEAADVADGQHTVEVSLYNHDDELQQAQSVDIMDDVTFTVSTLEAPETDE